LGDRQSSHPVKNPASIYPLEALPGVAYSGFRDNRSTLNTKTGFLEKWHGLSGFLSKLEYKFYK